MGDKTPKYALLDGREHVLIETVPHAYSNEIACVFAGPDGIRRYVSEAEWRAGAIEFSGYAAKRRLVTSESPNGDKIALFKSLFKGREDVYAHGFAKRDGGIGYSPVCANERTGNCPRWTRKMLGVKCADCPERTFIPINDRALINHFRGEKGDFGDVMGLYVLTSDCKAWVLIADFDKEGWQNETMLYRDACRAFGFFPAVERSRSGNGSHVWLFFEEPIDAELARNLGCAIITHAMEQAPGMSFKSYDRLFPTQSTIAQGGFGNLIALPFQGRAQRRSNSVFVNDDFEPFPDQWRFLSSVSKASLQQVREVVDSTANGPLGQLAFDRHPGKKEVTQAGITYAAVSLQTPDSVIAGFPKTVSVVKSNMLFVSKEGLSHKAQNRIRRLAAFGNPEFFKAQAMHRSVRNISRIIWCGDEDGQSIMLPRGCEEKLVNLAKEQGFSCAFDDRRNSGAPIKAEFSGTLRDRQQKAADALLRYENGVLMAPTGFGKTVIGAYIIGKLKMRTLIIVPKTNLIGQWTERLGQFLDIEDNRPPLLTKSGKPSKKKRPVIGQIGASKNAPSGIIDIATFQSLAGKDDLGIPCAKPVVEDYDLVICDECHNGAAPNYELIMKSVNARRVYGLSATPKRSDGLERVIFMHCGPIRHRVDPKEQAAEQGFKRVLEPRFTRIRLAGLELGASFNQMVELLNGHAARNALIAADAVDAIKAGRTPLVITNRKDHADELARLLVESGVETYVLTGEGTTREKRERLESIRNSTNAHYAIVATGAYIGEGFDLPRLDTLLLASPYSFEGVITQYSGRLHRENEGKADVVVYDYVDVSIPMLERMYKKRLKTYAKLGYEISEADEARGPGAHIVTSSAWHAEFADDLSSSNKTAVISAPYASPKLIELLTPDFAGAIARGIEIRVMLKKPKSEKSLTLQFETVEALMRIGCQVETCDAPLTGIAVFDGRISWYGTLPLLAFAKADDCSLRIESAEVASDLESALCGPAG